MTDKEPTRETEFYQNIEEPIVLERLREKIESTLKASETITDNPPYICLPAGNPEWIQLKTLRLFPLIKEALQELVKEASRREMVEWIISHKKGYYAKPDGTLISVLSAEWTEQEWQAVTE